jgi:hypothetical protein
LDDRLRIAKTAKVEVLKIVGEQGASRRMRQSLSARKIAFTFVDEAAYLMKSIS